MSFRSADVLVLCGLFLFSRVINNRTMWILVWIGSLLRPALGRDTRRPTEAETEPTAQEVFTSGEPRLGSDMTRITPALTACQGTRLRLKIPFCGRYRVRPGAGGKPQGYDYAAQPLRLTLSVARLQHRQ